MIWQVLVHFEEQRANPARAYGRAGTVDDLRLDAIDVDSDVVRLGHGTAGDQLVQRGRDASCEYAV